MFPFGANALEKTSARFRDGLPLRREPKGFDEVINGNTARPKARPAVL
jgi:hypothetical protein